MGSNRNMHNAFFLTEAVNYFYHLVDELETLMIERAKQMIGSSIQIVIM